MPRKADYSNAQKYSNRKSFDGQPVPDGKVLVPSSKKSTTYRKVTTSDTWFAFDVASAQVEKILGIHIL